MHALCGVTIKYIYSSDTLHCISMILWTTTVLSTASRYWLIRSLGNKVPHVAFIYPLLQASTNPKNLNIMRLCDNAMLVIIQAISLMMMIIGVVQQLVLDSRWRSICTSSTLIINCDDISPRHSKLTFGLSQLMV